ncbi:MAG: PT repeat-containing protein [Chloroflexi bacterium OLB15]|nr:MAG: PT repeat-containing protein [Chloroflexi bacterium OLB15]
MTRTQRIGLYGLVFAALLAILAWGQSSIGAQAVPTPPVPLGYPPNFAPGVNPLTGLAVTEPANLNRLPLIAKVSNAPDVVRPQAGIGAADVVWEHYAEGGLTRFSAVYLGNTPQRIGSIRSARLIDEELVPMFGALFTYSGASPGTEAVLQSSDFVPQIYSGFTYGAPLYFRDFSIAAPNNLFIDPAAVWAEAAADGLTTPPDLRGWIFNVIVPAGESGAGVTAEVQYTDNNVRWEFDPLAGMYRRFNDGLAHTDALTGVQVAASNVVILYADHLPTNIEEGVFNGVPYYGIDINLNGEGDAVVLRDGLQYPVRWRRYDRRGLLSLWTLDGQPFAMKPGQTWFQVFPLPEDQNGAEFVRIS